MMVRRRLDYVAALVCVVDVDLLSVTTYNSLTLEFR